MHLTLPKFKPENEIVILPVTNESVFWMRFYLVRVACVSVWVCVCECTCVISPPPSTHTHLPCKTCACTRRISYVYILYCLIRLHSVLICNMVRQVIGYREYICTRKPWIITIEFKRRHTVIHFHTTSIHLENNTFLLTSVKWCSQYVFIFKVFIHLLLAKLVVFH